MNKIFHFIAITFILLTYSGNVCAQDDIDYEKQREAEQWYADRVDDILLHFEGLRHDSGQHPQKYAVFPDKNAGQLAFSLALATWDERQIIQFSPDGNRVKGKVVKRENLPTTDVFWQGISNLGMSRTHSRDITLSQRPLPVRTMDKARNTFLVVTEGSEKINPNGYSQMIFKPHKNGVKLASKHANVKKDGEGNMIKDEMEFVFKLNNPSIVSKMFRGYSDNEASPWVVKNSFFNNHTLLQYSRWKEGETVKKAGPDVRRMISDYYGGRRIKDTQWMATTESGERSFYTVQFEHQGGDALASIVCVGAEGVISTWEFHGDARQDGQSIWFVDDEGDFMSHMPEIHCIVDTDEGLELYLRVFGGESVQYYILREFGSVWLQLLVDYWIYVWD